MIYSCCSDKTRLDAVVDNPALNAIDYLELLDGNNLYGTPDQRTLLVYCVKPIQQTVTMDNILIAGGESVTGITAVWVATANNPPAVPVIPQGLHDYLTGLPSAASILAIRTSVAGDFSPYTLRLVDSLTDASNSPFSVASSMAGFDPQLARVTFSFKVDCGPYFDCEPPAPICNPAPPTPPPIDYLAKDYGSFRTILLDRMNQLLPDWGATSEADLGVVLAELIAYVGDNLSYQQDAVATEAYLSTARSRISLRRHAKLVDYTVHDGCNARAWVCVKVAAPMSLAKTGSKFYTDVPGAPATLVGNEEAALAAGVVVFESMQDANLFPEHNLMQFYTWGESNCCLPQGATEATLAGSYPNLQAGDVLIFEEVLGPQTGDPADADIRHRYAVRLTTVATVNNQGAPLVDPLFEQGTGNAIVSGLQAPQPVTEIGWSQDDALPAPLCLSSTFIDSSGGTETATKVSVVYGNVVLADHGLTMPSATLATVPQPSLFVPNSASTDRCAAPVPPKPLPVRYRPQLADSPITQAVPLPTSGGPVTASPVPLPRYELATLSDSNGYTSLRIGPNQLALWPQSFGVVASEDALAGTFTLSVVFSPSGGPSNVVLERYPGLSNAGDAANQINKYSQLIAANAPTPAANPSTFPPNPTMLPPAQPVSLEDTHGAVYLTVKASSTATWPPLFAVLAQGNLPTPDAFNLLLLYNPPFGAVGVQLPVIVQQFNGVTLATAAAAFSVPPALLTVLTFEDQPNLSLSAYDLMNYQAAAAIPEVGLTGTGPDGIQTSWTAASDLLADGPGDAGFVVEVESNGVATLRFGDNTNGMAPASGTAFTANYRVGNGTAGNVGAQSLTRFVGDPRIVSCRNPLPATGGVDPETNAQIQRRAPQAFLTQERAVTMTDYVDAAVSDTQVESAAATLRWTGSWYTVFVTAEPQGGTNLGSALRRSLTKSIGAYRLAGQDLSLAGPQYVSLAVALTVCVDPSYFVTDVAKGLAQALGPGSQPNGQPGVFAAGNFKLGQNVYLSPIYAAARTVAGVTSVVATTFQPQAMPATDAYIKSGFIPIGLNQVARMANDPSLPANGQLTLNMLGGK